MPSAFMGLNIAYTGLVASNAALNTTANNIANIETKGYSRQVVNQTAATAMRAFQSYGCVGAGVDTLGAERVRDAFYDKKYWENNAKLGEFEKKQYYAKVVENYLTDQRGTNEVKGFTTIFGEYQAALESFSDNASQVTNAQTFIGKAGDLCEYFNMLYESFRKIQTDVNDEIKIEVDHINSIAQEIASLNKQINTVEVGGNSMANDLRDKRDKLVDDLSKIVDVKITEIPVTNKNNEETGINNYSVQIAGGQMLVEGDQYRTLQCIPRENWQAENINEVKGLYDVSWTDTGEDIGIFGKNVTGELKGLFEMRDGNNEESFSGRIDNVDMVKQTVSVKVTDSHLLDMSKSTIPLTDGRIRLGSQYYYYDSWKFTDNGDGTGTYVFKINEYDGRNEQMLTDESVNQNCTIGEKVNYQGIPYYLEQMNEWVRDYASAANKIISVENGATLEGKTPDYSVIFTGNRIDGTQFKLDVPLDTDKEFSSTDDGYFRLTAGNFNVLSSLENGGAANMVTHTIASDGTEKYDILGSLKALATDRDVLQFRGCASEDFLICMMGDAALNANSANSFVTVYSNIEETVQNSRYSISGVDADEEAANMIKFQNAYNLASKMISVLNQCYNKLINETGV